MAKKEKNTREPEGDTKPEGDGASKDGTAQPPAADVAPVAVVAPVTYTVRVPFSRFEGERGGVHFRQGVGTTDDPAIAADLASLGYTVEPTPPVAVVEPEQPAA